MYDVCPVCVHSCAPGWVGCNDPRDFYGEAQEEIFKLWAQVEREKTEFLANRARLRILSSDRKFQSTGVHQMKVAIRNRDFRKCIALAERGKYPLP